MAATRRETFLFRADFTELVKVGWSQLGPPFHQFDDVGAVGLSPMDLQERFGGGAGGNGR